MSQPAASSLSPVSRGLALTEAVPRGARSVPACETHGRLWHPRQGSGCVWRLNLPGSAVLRTPRAARAGEVVEQSPARSPTALMHQWWHADLRRAALLPLLLSWALGCRECLLLSNLLLKIVRSLKTELALWVRVGVGEDMLCIYPEITSFSVC